MLPALILGHLRQHLYGEKRKRNILLIFVSLAAYRISLHSFKEPRKNVETPFKENKATELHSV